MDKCKLLPDEPGRYRAKRTPDGIFVVLDYTLRLAMGGSRLEAVQPDGSAKVNSDPWVVWHHESGAFCGFQSRQAACRAMDELLAGVDVGSMLSRVRMGQPSAESCSMNVSEAPAVRSPARARAREGDYPAEFMRALQDRFPPEVLFERLEGAMNACSVTVQNGATISRPDWHSRNKALELVMAYLIGRPVERQQIVQASVPMSWDDILGQARNSPVFRSTLLDMLQKLERSVPNAA